MKIIVVCGAGASSTFVASRLERAAKAEGIALEALPAALPDLPLLVDGADAVLIGSHLGAAARRAVGDAPSFVLPHDIASDRDGTRALSLIRPLLPHGPENPNRKDATMATRTVTIAASHGLHARPAKLFAQAAKEAGIPVTIAKGDGKPANAASILAVIALGIDHGDEVTLAADGENAEQVLDDLAAFLSTDHDESA